MNMRSASMLFAYVAALRVLAALGVAAAAGTVCGFLGSQFFLFLNKRGIVLYPAAREPAMQKADAR